MPRKTRYFTEMQTLFGHFKFIPRAGEGGIIGSASSVLVIHPGTRTLSFIGNIRDGGQKYCGICTGDDGVLCCAPYDSASALLVRPFSEKLIWDRVATAGGKDFEMLMRAMMP